MKKPDDKPTASPRWTAPWRRQRVAAERKVDPADLGTCFGLELTLAAAPAPATKKTATARRPGWIKRLAQRRQPTY